MKRKLKNKDWKDEILPLSSFYWKKTTQIKTKQDVRYIDRLKGYIYNCPTKSRPIL